MVKEPYNISIISISEARGDEMVNLEETLSINCDQGDM